MAKPPEFVKHFILLSFLLCPRVLFAQDDSNPPMHGFNLGASHPIAVEIADLVMSSMGGRVAWDRTRYMSWTIFGQDHVWDKWGDRFRWQTDSTVVLIDLHSRDGRAFVHGNEIKSADELLVSAYRAWINAGYWLLMPYKLKDSGVTLGYKGEQTMFNGRTAHVLTLRFDEVGLTPNNGYDVYVDQETNLVQQWSYYANADVDSPNFTRTWEGYKNYGGIMLADTRAAVGNRTDVRKFQNLGTYSELPDAVFEDPGWVSLASLTEKFENH